MAATADQRAAFATTLRRLRRSSGLTQREVKTMLAGVGATVTEQAVSGWERGIFAPDRETCRSLDIILSGRGALSDALGYSYEPPAAEEPALISSSEGVDFDELRRLDPDGYEAIMVQARLLRDRARRQR